MAYIAGVLWLDRLHTNEGRKIGHVPVSVVCPKQLDVPRLVKLPVILQLGGILNCREYQISEKPCGAPISVRERMDAHGLGVHDDTQLPKRPVVGVLPPVSDGVERVSQFNGNLLRRDADVEL
jgi:hypothetical protein